jgi:hypothetical protein
MLCNFIFFVKLQLVVFFPERARIVCLSETEMI